MNQSPKVECKDPASVRHLKRSLYELTQATSVWNQKKIDDVLKNVGFQWSTVDACLHTKQVGGYCVYVLLYADDLIVTCNTERKYRQFVTILRMNFKIGELGDLTCFLGIQVRKEAGDYELNQKKVYQANFCTIRDELS